MSNRTWSTYQQAIFEAVKGSTNNLAINAVAGSGKTTTIVEAAKLMQPGDRVVFLAFNKHIVTELSSRLPDGVDCMTIHSLGMRACGRGKKLKVDAYKYRDIIDDTLILSPEISTSDHRSYRSVIEKMVDLGRLTLTNFQHRDEVDRLIDHHNINYDIGEIAENTSSLVEDVVVKLVATTRSALKRGLKLYEDNGIIDFTDMLWLPYVRSLPVPRYDVVMVDEAQDLSKAQAEIVLRAAGDSGRVIAVGDPRQAIQGFAGADNESFSRLVEKLKARVLPLSVCYRCPTKHIEMAKEIVKGIEPSPGAIEGSVEHISMDRFLEMPRSGDLIVCRTNAPLIGAALRLIGKGVQARVRGRNIGKQLSKFGQDADKIQLKQEYSGWIEDFTAKLERYVELKIKVLEQRRYSEQAVEAIQDQNGCLLAYLEGKPETNSLDDLVSGIEALFEDKDAAVWLSSIHRAKGLEADRVFVLKPDKMALTWKNQLPWQVEQEQNLRYVGLTRAKKALYFVNDATQ